ncbi:hypothetical protein ACGFZA_42085 [Streptomyces sp. NPDC048211]|uniref:hypothetical protein n=1 Tax=Streptomyces sp. NPDC048211 TaxID=3365516 RepID=UPI0037115B13
MATPRPRVECEPAEGHLGSFAWSYSGIDGHGSWDDVKDKLKAWRSAPDRRRIASASSAMPKPSAVARAWLDLLWEFGAG